MSWQLEQVKNEQEEMEAILEQVSVCSIVQGQTDFAFN